MMQSKIYRFLDYLLRLILLNALIVIPAFSFFLIYELIDKEGSYRLAFLTLIPLILWLFPSIVAVTDVIKQYETDETNTIFKDFFRSFGKNYLKSIIITFILAILIILLYNSITYFFKNARKDTLHLLCFFLSISIAFVAILIAVQIPLVMAYFKKLRIWELLKLSCIMTFKNLGINILIALMIIGIGAIDITLNYVMITIGFSVPIYITIKMSFKQYIKIYRKVEE
jgi:membrane protein